MTRTARPPLTRGRSAAALSRAPVLLRPPPSACRLSIDQSTEAKV